MSRSEFISERMKFFGKDRIENREVNIEYRNDKVEVRESTGALHKSTDDSFQEAENKWRTERAIWGASTGALWGGSLWSLVTALFDLRYGDYVNAIGLTAGAVTEASVGLYTWTNSVRANRVVKDIIDLAQDIERKKRPERKDNF